MFRVVHTSYFPLFVSGIAAVLAFGAPAYALSIDAAAMSQALASAHPVTGVVRELRSARGADGVLRSQVTLQDGAGQDVAQFSVLGGVEGGLYWVVDGVPAFVTGETVEVSLVNDGTGSTLAPTEDAVRRITPAVSGRSGSAYSAEPTTLPPSVTDVEPSIGAAVPDDPFVVTVKGFGFGAVQGESRITFQGIFERVDAAVIAWSNNSITCRVPAPNVRGTTQVLSGPIKVWTNTGGWSDGNEFIGGARYSVLFQWAGDAWKPGRLPVSIYVNPTGSPWGAGLGPIVADAAAQWDVPGSFARLEYRGLTQADGGSHAADLTPRDGRNTVRWRNDWPYTATYLAITWSAIDTLTYEREETELEINGKKGWTLDPEDEPEKFDLPSTLTHEFGHWLRLGHTQNVASVMLAFVGSGTRRRQISPADSYGASWIHPSYGVVTAPAVATGGALDLSLVALDRQGNPRARLAKSAISVRAVPVPEEPMDALTPRVTTLDQAIAGGPDGVPATRDTDDDGRTAAQLTSLPDGRYRIEATIAGHFVRPAPFVRVGAAPVAPTPAFSFAGVSPQPLAPGVRGLVRFSLPSSAQIRIDLYDARGRLVRAVANERFAAGPHTVALETTGADGRTAAPGVYFLRMVPVAGLDFEPRAVRVVMLR
jgi:hypothetical protein